MTFVKTVTKRANLDSEHQGSQQDSEARLQAIVENVVDAVITIDEQGIIEFANNAIFKLFGYAPEEIIGRNVKVLMPAPYSNEHDSYIQHYLDGGEAKIIGIGREILGQRKDKTVFPAELAVSEVQIGGQRYFTGILRDITERKQAEKQLANHAKSLQEANEMLSEFAYAVSHDLKAPLRAVRNYADFLHQDLGETLGGEQQDYLQGLLKATKEADELIEDLLSYSQVNTAKSTVEKINLGDYVRGVLKGLSIPDDVDVEVAGDWPVVKTVPALIKQIIQNLATNAVKFGPKENKHVELGCRTDDENRVEISVRDNGIGIEQRFFKQIYEIFKRLHTRDEYEGTGIGLAIVKKAVNRLNGEVWVESEPGVGSTFFVSLPLQKVEDPHD